MKINDVEKLLNISRANIRFYEKEGLIKPERNKNGYRNYSDADTAQLKKIIVFRKIGVSISDIKRIFNSEIPLNDIIQSNIAELEQQISELNGALIISKEIAQEKASIDCFDEEFYFKKINEEEIEGNKFNDILNDFIDFEKNIFANMWKNVFFFNYSGIEKKHGVVKALFIVLLICIIRGLLHQFVWHSKTFFEAFIYPFVLFFCVSLIFLPIYLLSKKHKKAASILAAVITLICIFFLAAILILFIYIIIQYLIKT